MIGSGARSAREKRARIGWKPAAMGMLLATTALHGALAATGASAGAAAGASAGAAAAPQVAQQGRTVTFAIAAGPLPGVLAAYGQATGFQVLYPTGIAQGLSSPGVSGSLSPREALIRLLSGTGLTARFVDAETVTLEKATAGAGGAMVLDPVTVQGASLTDRGRTEGTGSYTTGSTATATKLPLSPRETPQSVSVITRQRIEDQGRTEIREVLDQTVGVTRMQGAALGSDGSEIFSRGFAVKNFQVDGIPRSTVYGFDDSISDMAIFDRVEVVRGATGLLNGVGDPSAAVNLVRKRPTATVQGYLQGQVGSWDRYRGEADLSGPLVGNGRLRGRVVGAYQDNDTFIDRLHERKRVLYGVLEADVTEDTTWTVGVEHQKHKSDNASRAGFPLFYADGTRTDFSRSYNSGANWAYFMHDNLTVFSEVKHRFADGWTATLNVEHNNRNYDGLLGYGVRGSLNRDGTGMGVWPGRWKSNLQQTSVSADVSGPFELFGRRHDLMAGVSGYYAKRSGLSYPLWYITGYNTDIPNYFTWNGNIAQPTLTPTGWSQTNERQTAVYAATRLRPTDDLSVILGSRLSRWEQSEEGHPNGAAGTYGKRSENGVFTPYAGIVYDLTDIWSVYGSYTSIFKPQDSKDAAGRTLDPLEGDAYEAGVKAEFLGGRLNASAAVFLIQQDNLAVVDSGRFTPDGGQAYKAAKGAKSKGFELELSGEVLEGWQVGGGYSRTTIKDAGGQQLMTYVPKDSVKLFTTYRLPGAWDRLTVGGNVKWQGAIYNGTGRSRYDQDGYAVVDLMARYRITETVSAAVNLNNLFDKKYLTSIQTNGYYGEPRNVLFTLKANW
ncbi:outer membrane receptor for ferric coprogen and ferric-rhodotorulic acid [Azospirillum agricola]|uniref:TonB-dependent siderophore receptor n=1 Tax=Azospirillum agricola TaxID=1720247 RepID=UPI001F2A7D68|nr:TonB-dependent siderophore receptor [Azospirillum agricola]MBP2228742.1 outer membrane receptor for ferric coprogen and ferric-rhodotorulic acid [Azospirillum agricola]